jgi:hypothetical protein
MFPSRVVAAKIEGGWRPRVTGRHIVDAVGTDPAAADAVAAWQPTTDALDELLAALAAPGVPATVIVSSRFVRYCIVPWRDNVVGVSEQTEFARHCFRSIYGETAAAWEIRISSGGFRRNALASAVDAAMLRAVEARLAAHGIPIASIQPNFMAACNRFRRELNGYDSGCIAVLEPGRVALGIFDKAGWRTLGTRRIGTLKPEALVPVLAQELKSAHTDTLPEYLFVAAVSPTAHSFFRTRTKAWMSPARTRIPESVP